MTNLFENFKKPDYETWVNQLKKDLKDQPIESLTTQPERELKINAFYHPVKDKIEISDSVKFAIANKKNNDWFIRELYSTLSKDQILKDLNDGINSIGLIYADGNNFDAKTSGILFEHIQSDIYFEKSFPSDIKFHPKSYLNYDIINRLVAHGTEISLDSFVDFYQAFGENKKLWITGKTYGNAGASTINELAFCLAHLYEYVHLLSEKNIHLEDINQNVIVEISLSNNYFLNIAKIRALRLLIQNLFQNIKSDFKPKPVLIYGTTSSVYNTLNDANNNYLRQTTQAMSGIIGGCDTITVDYLNTNDDKQNLQNKRIAKNIQLLLKEESYFDKVVDVAAGSYAAEKLTQQLIESAWKKFCLIEDNGGFLASFKSGFVQEEIQQDIDFLIESVQKNSFNFVGVSKYQNKNEAVAVPNQNPAKGQSGLQILKPFSLEMAIVEQLQKTK